MCNVPFTGYLDHDLIHSTVKSSYQCRFDV